METTYNGNVALQRFEEQLSEADRASVENGQYPLILAQNGVFTKIHVSIDDLPKYSNWDAKDEDAAAQRELHGMNLPIVWESNGVEMIPTGIEHKVIEQENND